MPTSTQYAKYSGIGGGSGGGGGVTSLNGEIGAVNIVAGSGITVTPAGQNITIAATGAELTFADSIVNTAGTVTLVNDSAAPGSSKYYGTNSGSTLGYFSFPTSGTVTSISVVSANGLAGTVATATTTPAITLSTSITGILQGNGTAISAATTGNLTDIGTDGIVVTGGSGAVLGSGTSLAQHVADTTHNGYLSSIDWNTFNGKQGAGNYITALTGDVTATGPGSVAATLATVNANVGSFGSSTSIPNFTVNAKGLMTAAGGNVVIAPAGTLTGTTLASNVVSSSLTSVGTLTAGTWNATTIDVAHGGTNATSFTAYSVICGGTTSTGTLQNVSGLGSSGQVLTSNGPAALPTWQASGAGSGSVAYAQAFFDGTVSTWSTTSSTYADATNSGGNALTVRQSSGITLTAAASNVCGVTFTPRSSTSIYKIFASVGVYTGTTGSQVAVRMIDSNSLVISTPAGWSQQSGTAASSGDIAVEGVYVPGTSSAITIRLQLAVNAGTGFIASQFNLGLGNSVEWTVIEIPTNLIGQSLGLANFGSTPNAQGGSVSSSTLTLQPASASFPGGVSTTAQTFAGAKSITTSGGSTTAFNIDSPSFVFDSTNNALGIGNAPNSATFLDGLNTSGATKRILLTGYGTASLVGMRTRLARGTSGSPTAVQAGDILGFYNAEGYGTSQFPTTGTGAITILAGETFTNTSNQTYVTINSTPSGAVTSTENFRVASTGLTIGPQSSSTLIHQINGGMNGTTRTITGNLTVDTTTSDYIIFVTTASGAISVTLPAPTAGRILILKDISGQANTNNITVVRHASEQIEGLATSKLLTTNWGSWTITSDGTNWFFI